MPEDDNDPAATVRAEAARLAAEASLAAARGGLERTADGALDAVEKLLFGKVGGAAEAVRAESSADALERLRAQYRDPATGGPAVAPPPSREEAEAEARRQLAELKADRKARREGGDVKKTL